MSLRREREQFRSRPNVTYRIRAHIDDLQSIVFACVFRFSASRKRGAGVRLEIVDGHPYTFVCLYCQRAVTIRQVEVLVLQGENEFVVSHPSKEPSHRFT